MLSALPPTHYPNPALGAVIYVAIVGTLVGSAVVAARRGRNRRRPPRR